MPFLTSIRPIITEKGDLEHAASAGDAQSQEGERTLRGVRIVRVCIISIVQLCPNKGNNGGKMMQYF